MSKVLQIDNLHASIDGKEILKGVTLTIRQGEVHALMGPTMPRPLASAAATRRSSAAGLDARSQVRPMPEVVAAVTQTVNRS